MKTKIIHLILSVICILVFTFSTDRDKNSIEPKDEIEHGIIDFYSIEEIVPDVTTKEQVKDKLGYPDGTRETDERLYYYYPKFGIRVAVLKINGLVDGISAYGDHWSYNYSNSSGSYTPYEYETDTGLSLEDQDDTMNDVINLYGQPKAKFTLNDSITSEMYPRGYIYTKDSLGLLFTMNFYFVGSDTNDYKNKPITLISLW